MEGPGRYVVGQGVGRGAVRVCRQGGRKGDGALGIRVADVKIFGDEVASQLLYIVVTIERHNIECISYCQMNCRLVHISYCQMNRRLVQ